MEIAGIIILVLSVVIYFGCLFGMEDQGLGFSLGMLDVGMFFVGCFLMASAESKTEPTAIDVYRGYTTLQITYEDSIPTDTVVVFKKEYKK